MFEHDTIIWLSDRRSASAARSTACFITSGNRTVIDVSLRCFIASNVRHSMHTVNGVHAWQLAKIGLVTVVIAYLRPKLERPRRGPSSHDRRAREEQQRAPEGSVERVDAVGRVPGSCDVRRLHGVAPAPKQEPMKGIAALQTGRAVSCSLQ